ncbi:uncharacterized protein VTP21DRAFT_6623 [Calcarisporiella thermophila]|uniref:uncharacterized protein n=1 Tax=Calcarisporiella thermophila TaxID=911321 RepID=UPI0037425D27
MIEKRPESQAHSQYNYHSDYSDRPPSSFTLPYYAPPPFSPGGSSFRYGQDSLSSWQTPNRRSNISISVHDADINNLHVIKRLPEVPRDGPQRWTKYKWCLIFSNTLLFAYGIGGMLAVLLTWFKLYLRADIMIVGEDLIIKFLTAVSVLCIITSLIGYTGIMLNNRKILTIYNMLLWPCFALILAIGYVAYRKAKVTDNMELVRGFSIFLASNHHGIRAKWNLEAKLSYQWHRKFTTTDRLRMQANLHCCGYRTFDDYSERSNRCFPRTLLPGCKFKYTQFTTQVLFITWVTAFTVVVFHIFVIFSALLCSNQINRTFGKHLPPKMYHLNFQKEVKRPVK